MTPSFKLYLLNGNDVFFGYYPVYRRAVENDGRPRTRYGLKGKDATLFHYSATGREDELETQQVAQARAWFDSVWTIIAKDRTV